MYTLILKSNNREAFIDGVQLDPEPSQKIINHSPDGFMWGYGGSGPAQLALAILLHVTDDAEKAQRFYQAFKWHFVAMLPNNGVLKIEIDIKKWLADEEAEKHLDNSGSRYWNVISNEPDTSPVVRDELPTCGKGWSNRCAAATSKVCRCKCGGRNHGGLKRK